MLASLSVPIRASRAEWAPSRAVATAWLEPLPPGPMSKSVPSMVSPKIGSFGARIVNPTANEPTTVTSGFFIAAPLMTPSPAPEWLPR